MENWWKFFCLCKINFQHFPSLGQKTILTLLSEVVEALDVGADEEEEGEEEVDPVKKRKHKIERQLTS